MNNSDKRILVGNIQRFSVEDGPGIRTTVFLKGCPLECKWCHNPELINPNQELIRLKNNCIECGHCINVCPQGAISLTPEAGIDIDRNKCNLCFACTEECYSKALRTVATYMTVNEIIDKVEQDKDFYNLTGGGMTISGGELLMHSEFVYELIKEAGKRKINVCIDTSGFGDIKWLTRFASEENVTNILYDIKSLNDEIHIKYTGVSNKLILENLKALCVDAAIRDKIIIRMPLIHEVNDDMDLLKMTGEFIKENHLKIVNFLLYHNLGINKKKNIGGTQIEFEKPDDHYISVIESYFKNELNLEVEILGLV